MSSLGTTGSLRVSHWYLSVRKDHNQNLEAVFTRMEQTGLRLKKAKCSFMMPSVEYLGHPINGKELHPTVKTIKAVEDALPPQDITQLKSFLGLINYYTRFLPDLTFSLSPITEWTGGQEQEKAFHDAKTKLTSDYVLVHYSTKELVLACDASPYSVGAILSHRFNDSQERRCTSASLGFIPRRISCFTHEKTHI